MNEAWQYALAAIGGLGGAYALIEKIFGGGNKLANMFHNNKEEMRIALETSNKKHEAEIATIKATHAADMVGIRNDFFARIDNYNENSKQGFDAIGANIHALQLGFSEFRAQMAENYMRRESFDKIIDQMKTDVKAGIGELKADIRSEFTEVKADLDGLAKSVEAARRERA